MRHLSPLLLVSALALALSGCCHGPSEAGGGISSDAGKIVSARLPVYGHRNWIVITDSAYPAQSSEGIETLAVDGTQTEVLAKVLAAVRASGHVRANVLVDAELAHVREAAAPGIGEFRTALAAVLAEEKPLTLPHERIIGRLDTASKTFRVLILKTRSKLPYSSVFLELNCGYWSDEAERALRSDIAASAGK